MFVDRKRLSYTHCSLLVAGSLVGGRGACQWKFAELVQYGGAPRDIMPKAKEAALKALLSKDDRTQMKSISQFSREESGLLTADGSLSYRQSSDSREQGMQEPQV